MTEGSRALRPPTDIQPVHPNGSEALNYPICGALFGASLCRCSFQGESSNGPSQYVYRFSAMGGKIVSGVGNGRFIAPPFCSSSRSKWGIDLITRNGDNCGKPSILLTTGFVFHVYCNFEREWKQNV